MGLQKVFGTVLFAAFFLCLHFWLRFWAAGADIAGHVCNQGGSFGVSLPMWLLIAFSLAILALFAAYYPTERPFSAQWPWILIISGGLGNLLERLLFGCIMDYVTLPFFPAFNVADIFLAIGVAGILLQRHHGNEKCKDQNQNDNKKCKSFFKPEEFRCLFIFES